MKEAGKVCGIVFLMCVTAFVAIHRHVILAAIKGEPMPEPPEWHKKFFCHTKAED